MTADFAVRTHYPSAGIQKLNNDDAIEEIKTAEKLGNTKTTIRMIDIRVIGLNGIRHESTDTEPVAPGGYMFPFMSSGPH